MPSGAAGTRRAMAGRRRRRPGRSAGAVANATRVLTIAVPRPGAGLPIGPGSIVMGRALVALALGPAPVAVVTRDLPCPPPRWIAGMAAVGAAVVCRHRVPRGLDRWAAGLRMDRSTAVRTDWLRG